jgi:hypothetical protein
MNVPVSEEHYVNEDVEIGRQLVISGPELEVKRESWLLDIQYPVDDYENISSGWGQRTVYGCKKCSTFHKCIPYKNKNKKIVSTQNLRPTIFYGIIRTF